MCEKTTSLQKTNRGIHSILSLSLSILFPILSLHPLSPFTPSLPLSPAAAVCTRQFGECQLLSRRLPSVLHAFCAEVVLIRSRSRAQPWQAQPWHGHGAFLGDVRATRTTRALSQLLGPLDVAARHEMNEFAAMCALYYKFKSRACLKCETQFAFANSRRPNVRNERSVRGTASVAPALRHSSRSV